MRLNSYLALSLIAALAACASVPPAAIQPPQAPVAAVEVTPAPPAASTPPADLAKPASSVGNSKKRRQKSLLGATYVRNSNMPRALGSGWKIIRVIDVGRDGGTDLFLAEKKGEQRLLLAGAQKHWLKNLYRYAVLAEQSLPNEPAGLIATACASAADGDYDELALLDNPQPASIAWLARAVGNRIQLVSDAGPVQTHRCQPLDPSSKQALTLLWPRSDTRLSQSSKP